MSQQVLRVLDTMSENVVTAKYFESAQAIVSKILGSNVGCVVILGNNDEVVGIVTKGDVLAKVVMKGEDPRNVPAEKIMSQDVVTIGKHATLEEASRLMTRRKVSKLPVIEREKLVGIITSTDIIRSEPMQVGYLEELVEARYVPHERIC
jgi:CBS domain-containing protein